MKSNYVETIFSKSVSSKYLKVWLKYTFFCPRRWDKHTEEFFLSKQLAGTLAIRKARIKRTSIFLMPCSEWSIQYKVDLQFFIGKKKIMGALFQNFKGDHSFSSAKFSKLPIGNFHWVSWIYDVFTDTQPKFHITFWRIYPVKLGIVREGFFASGMGIASRKI